MKKIKNSYFKVIILIFTISLTFTCSDVDTKTANVKINLGLNSAYSGQISRAQAPSNITDIELTITGSGMRTLTSDIPTETGVLSINVPIGSDRLFSVSASVSDSNFTYGGTSTIDVTAEGPNTVDITMAMQQATLNVTIPNQSNYTGTVQYFIVSVAIEETSGTEQMMFTPSDTITMPVPPGSNRGISVVTVPNSSSAVVSFSTETSTSDFVNGEDVDVSLSPAMTETKLIIPDYANNRIVQIDNFSTPNWIDKNGADIGVGAVLDPYDIDFDMYGRIYIARNSDVAGGGRIYRINTVQDTTAAGVYSVGTNGVETISIDRSVVPHIIYFAENNGGTLQKATLPNSDTGLPISPTTLDTVTDSITGITGIDYGSGLLFITYGSSPATYASYNTTTERVIGTPVTKNLGGSSANSSDIMFKDSYVYAFYIDTGGADHLYQFTINGSNELVESGDYTTGLLSPQRFVDNYTTKIYFLQDSVTAASMTVVDDIVGTGRDDYGSLGAGIGNFNF